MRKAAIVLVVLAAVTAHAEIPQWTVDPLTRYIHIQFQVPRNAPDLVYLRCEWSPRDKNEWQAANVMPYVSETALHMLPSAEWTSGRNGVVTERNGAGLIRTVVFNPYPEAQQNGLVNVDFRIRCELDDRTQLAEGSARIEVDNTDIVYIEDWSKPLTPGVIDETGEVEGLWQAHMGIEDGTNGTKLTGDAGEQTALPQLAYNLGLNGRYAIFAVTVPGDGGVDARLSADERFDLLASPRPGQEVLWQFAKLGRQNLVLKQPHRYTGYAPASIDYLKCVPLTPEQFQAQTEMAGNNDKFVAGYFEPYSWAFHERVRHPLQHREPLTAYRDAKLDMVDIQTGRFGMKVVYESTLTDQLLQATIGDPIGNVSRPTTMNVGAMQQFTNTLENELRYCRELGLNAHANFGASNCYPGTPLQGDFSKAHPEWMRGSTLRFEVPEVREYALSLFREVLELGAPGISIDFCRYPETIDTAETCNTFLRDLRALTAEFAEKREQSVSILVRFPGTGVRRAELFDYRTWVEQGWVDYIAPSNIQGRHLHIDMEPYMKAVDGTGTKLLPCVDGLGWGLPFPGPFLQRVHQLYEQDIPGVYIYQADARLLGRPEHRRTMALLNSGTAVEKWIERDVRLRPQRSKGIYITSAHQIEGYNKWERIRVWLEGVEQREMEFFIDGKLVYQCGGPPYHLGSEDYDGDTVIPPGEHRLKIRARDGETWLEQTFTITGA